jgi:tetratricopeptide (TPR) repeat protein
MNDLFIRPKDAPDGFAPKVDNWRRSAKVPMLVLNATTLNTGHNWQFTASWMGESPSAISSEIDANDLLRRMYYWEAPREHRRVRLGSAVAASACVPGLFEPLVLPRLYPERTVQLVDGGVHDNQGIGGLIEQDCAVVLVSDASGHLASQNKPPTEMLDVLPRSNGILMARVREAEFRELQARRRGGVLRGFMFVHLKKDVAPVNWLDAPRIASPPAKAEMTSYGVQRDVQNALANVRTDLDSFCDAEAYALMLSGYRMTAREFERSLPRFPVAGDGAGQARQPRAAPPTGSGTWQAPAAPPDRSGTWSFLSMDQPLRKERGHEDAHRLLLKQLTAAQSRGFKVWRLAPAFTIATLLLLAAAIAVGIPQVHIDWSRASRGFGYGGHALLVGVGLVAIAGAVFRWAEVPKSATQLVLGVLLLIGGWLGAIVHLVFYDPLYLAWGRVGPEAGGQRLRTLARLLGGAVAPAAVALTLLVLLATWQRSGMATLRAEGRAAQERRSYSEALNLWGQVLHTLPNDPEARTGRARAYLAMSQPEPALQELTPLGEITDTAILRVRAAANQQMGNTRAAADDLGRILTEYPRDAQVLRDRAYARRQLQEYGGALDDYTRSLEIEPNAQAEQDRAYVIWLLSREQRPQSAAPSYTVEPPPATPQAQTPAAGQTPAPEALRPRVYIQWAGPYRSRDLAALERQMKARGFDVLTPQQVSAVPEQSEVRYYFDADRSAADRLAKALQETGLTVAIKQIKSGGPRPGHLELWLAKDARLADKTAK